ncbi:hypothetical protein IFM89_038698 [Coptis chinensis]|uniref:AB hydrolase-1 domain-containing protein n=1 Tax=Coptis chinensis TaxID=261450 RepID=A0A835H1F1_9MAGN|nr:hypothetical protein IFM89_038698 [Coptis chinensis]
MLGKIAVAVVVGVFGWAYSKLQPPPPKICRSPNGPVVTSPRIKLSDGRFLAYKEKGVPKEEAMYKIIVVHGFDSSKDFNVPASLELVEELGIYFCCLTELVMEKVIQTQSVRIAGMTLVAPLVNFWWPSFPANLFGMVYKRLLRQDQWAFRVAHYAPWLLYWWLTQKWFPSLSALEGHPGILSNQDKEILKKMEGTPQPDQEKTRQQGVFESLHRDLIVGFGDWGFEPMELNNPFTHNESSVHIWQGYEDKVVPALGQRYVSQKLPWIQYHEVPDGGHLLIHEPVFVDAIIRELLLGEEPSITYLCNKRLSIECNPFWNGEELGLLSGFRKAVMFIQIALSLLLVALLGWAYWATHPPPPKICGSPGGPPVTAPRIKLSDGRHLAYLEMGVPKEKAKYKVIAVHGISSSKDLLLPVSRELIEELGIYILAYDRAGYSESDPNPERLAGAALISPVVNYWWPSLPSELSKEVYRKLLFQTQWGLRVAHYTPRLLYWLASLSSMSNVSRVNPALYNHTDMEIIRGFKQTPFPGREKVTQQGDFESIVRDILVGYGNWDFDPLDLVNPFVHNESSVHIWQGYEDKIIPALLQRYVPERLPWIKYHEVPYAGHLLVFTDTLCDAIFRALLIGEEQTFIKNSDLQELIEELGIYILAYGRAGYVESDPNPKRSVKSEAFDLQELADQLDIGEKFYVIGTSMGGYTIWVCLKHIPHRLAGAALISPVINYWWPSLPSKLTKEVYTKMLFRDQWGLRVAHYTPRLLHWLATREHVSDVLKVNPAIYSPKDMEILNKMLETGFAGQEKAAQQGEFESIHRDILVGFGNWDFDPIELNSHFHQNESSVQIWQGYEDKLVPALLQRYIAERLPWIRYHEVPYAGHLLVFTNNLCDAIFRALLIGEEPTIF